MSTVGRLKWILDDAHSAFNCYECIDEISWSLDLLLLHLYQSWVIHTQTCCQMCEKHRWPQVSHLPLSLTLSYTHQRTTMEQFASQRVFLHWRQTFWHSRYLPHDFVCMSKTNLQKGRCTDLHLFLCPSDQQQYEPGTGLCVSACLLAHGQRVGLQTLCFCPHTPHTPHAGGGGGQLMVVCINFLSICSISVCVQFVFFCALTCDMSSGIGRTFRSQMSHLCKCSIGSSRG